MKQTTANQLAALLIQLDNAIEQHDAVCEQLTAHSIKQRYTRDEARPAVVQYVANKFKLPINDKYQFVKQTGALKTKWDAARKRVQRLLAPIYAEPKPAVKRNKNDRQTRIDSAEKRLVASFSTAELRQLIKQLQARV